MSDSAHQLRQSIAMMPDSPSRRPVISLRLPSNFHESCAISHKRVSSASFVSKIRWKHQIAQIIVIIKLRRLERSCSAPRLQIVLSDQTELISCIGATTVRNSFASSQRNESCDHYVSRMQNVGAPIASLNPKRSYAGWWCTLKIIFRQQHITR